MELTNQVEHSSTTTTTLLIGDSMIKNVQGWHLGKAVGHKVIVKPFPGANARAMKDYLKTLTGAETGSSYFAYWDQ